MYLGDTFNHLKASSLQESWVRVSEELLEVCLEPSTGFWSWLESIGSTASGIVSDSAGVGGSDSLSTWLDPDERVEEGRASGLSWSETETGTDDVAPVTLLELSSWLNTVTGCVHDEVSIWPSGGGESWGESLDVSLLVAVDVW